jgi:hypothetical protein
VIPTPSDEVLVRLAAIAAHVEDMLAPDNPAKKERVGLKTIKNEQRRTMETVMVLLADPEVRDFLAELEKLGLLPIKG